MAKDISLTNSPEWEPLKESSTKKNWDAKMLTNLIVQGNNGISYCIQYRDETHQIQQSETIKLSNGSKLVPTDKQKRLLLDIFPRQCPLVNQDLFSQFDKYSAKKKMTLSRTILSSYFTYKGPCQAALTDAASVSKASSNHINFNFNKLFYVILVVTLNYTWSVLYIFYLHEAS